MNIGLMILSVFYSYSETVKQFKYGINNAYGSLTHIYLTLLFKEKSGLPFYYRNLAGKNKHHQYSKACTCRFHILDLRHNAIYGRTFDRYLNGKKLAIRRSISLT